jgi:DNA-binding MarR family transcriptional regulator
MRAMANRKATRTDTTPAGKLDEARLHDVIGYQVAQASIATLGVFHRLVGGPLELRPVEYTILVLIKENPGGTAARLARALAVTAPNITMWLERLEGRGLVRREASATDRRTQHVHVTEKGRRTADEATQRLLDGERQAFAHLSIGERTLLVELLHKVASQRANPG